MYKKMTRPAKTFPEIVQAALDQQERPQAWLARKCGITYAAMNRIMKGKASPSVSTIYSTSQVLGIDFLELICTQLGGDNP